MVVLDIDSDAVARGCERQGFSRDPGIRALPARDVTGILNDLAALRNKPQSDAVVDQCLRKLGEVPALDIGPSFPIVASTGLLTQLMAAVVDSIGELHPRFWEIVSAVRLQHLRLLLSLLAPGGVAALTIETLASDSCPELLSVADHHLVDLLDRERVARNFFTGTNPVALRQLLRTHPLLSPQIHRMEFTQPWRWNFSASRIYAVYGLLLFKTGDGDGCAIH